VAAREKVLGPNHPDTLNVQLYHALNLINLKRPYYAMQTLERVEPHLLEFAGLQLRHTNQEKV